MLLSTVVSVCLISTSQPAAGSPKMSAKKYSLSDQEKNPDDSFRSQRYSSKKDEASVVCENGETGASSDKVEDKKKEGEKMDMVGVGEVVSGWNEGR